MDVSAADVDPFPLRLRLETITYAAKNTNLYTFVSPDGETLPAAAPGAHIGLKLANGLERQYSLVEASESADRYTVGIKKDPKSRGGSAFIHDKLKVGDIVPISPPRNNFPLNEEAERSVFFAGGIGITPIYCMAQRVRKLGKPFQMYYSCRSQDEAAFRKELKGWGNVSFHFDEEQGGQIFDIRKAVAAAPAGAHLYCCGPAPMIDAFVEAAKGRPDEEVHVEYFRAATPLATEGSFTVELARSGMEVPVAEGQTILEALRDAGVDVQSSCEEGVCGACETRVLEGIPDHRDHILTPQEREDNETMMICCSGSKTERLKLDL